MNSQVMYIFRQFAHGKSLLTFNKPPSESKFDQIDMCGSSQVMNHNTRRCRFETQNCSLKNRNLGSGSHTKWFVTIYFRVAPNLLLKKIVQQKLPKAAHYLSDD